MIDRDKMHKVLDQLMDEAAAGGNEGWIVFEYDPTHTRMNARLTHYANMGGGRVTVTSSTEPRTCPAVTARQDLIKQLRHAIGMEGENDGTESELLTLFGHLSGIFAEYTDGGDEMAEMCDCGAHRFNRRDVTFDELVKQHRSR